MFYFYPRKKILTPVSLPADIMTLIFKQMSFTNLLTVRGVAGAYYHTITPQFLKAINAREFSPEILEAARAIVSTFVALVGVQTGSTLDDYCQEAGVNFIAKRLTKLDGSNDGAGDCYEFRIKNSVLDLLELFGLKSEDSQEQLFQTYRTICIAGEPHPLFQHIQCLLLHDAIPKSINAILTQAANQIKILFLPRENVDMRLLSRILVNPNCNLVMLGLINPLSMQGMHDLMPALIDSQCKLKMVYFGSYCHIREGALLPLAQAVAHSNFKLTTIYVEHYSWIQLSMQHATPWPNISVIIPTGPFNENKISSDDLKKLAEAIVLQGCQTRVVIGNHNSTFGRMVNEEKKHQMRLTETVRITPAPMEKSVSEEQHSEINPYRCMRF